MGRPRRDGIPSGVSATEGAHAARPNAPAEALALAQRHWNAGRMDAQALCEGILKERPHEAQAFHLLGLIAYREAVNLMGQIAFERGAYEAALAFYEREVALAPDAPDALANRGHVLRELNRSEPAVASFERALAIAPRHAVALGGLIDCALRTCDWARAVALA